MILRNFLNFVNQFFLNISYQIKNIYLNSKYYDKKISKIGSNDLVYKPSPHLLSSLIKYQTKKININDISVDNLWDNENFSLKDFKRLNNFYWFFSLDLKSSKKNIQKIILNWIYKNKRYNTNSWEFDLTSKRIIAWLSNHNLTLNENDNQYQNQFNGMIKKQTNHLINEINKSNVSSFLSVLKRFGDQESNFSFPMKGYTIALDFPVSRDTFNLLEKLDEITLKYNGRFYLAKDARMSKKIFERSDKRIQEFINFRNKNNFIKNFRSSQSSRLEI